MRPKFGRKDALSRTLTNAWDCVATVAGAGPGCVGTVVFILAVNNTIGVAVKVFFSRTGAFCHLFTVSTVTDMEAIRPVCRDLISNPCYLNRTDFFISFVWLYYSPVMTSNP